MNSLKFSLNLWQTGPMLFNLSAIDCLLLNELFLVIKQIQLITGR